MSKRVSRDELRDEKDSHLTVTLFDDNHLMICLNLHNPNPACFFLHLEGAETVKLYVILQEHFGMPDEDLVDPTEP